MDPPLASPPLGHQPQSVRVRRQTVSRAPNFDVPTTTAHPLPSPELLPGRRRRAPSLTERLFADNPYTPLSGVEQDDDAVAGRPRSSSNASGGSNPARASAPVTIAMKGRRASVSAADEEGAGNIPRRRRGPSVVQSITGSLDDQHHAEQEVDLLEILDQSVATTAHLSNIQSAFLPNFMQRQPVCELEPPTPPTATTPDERDEDAAGAHIALSTSEALSFEQELAEDADPLDVHLIKMLKKQKRKDQTKLVLKGIWSFLKTPLGVFFAIYGLLVVVWGAGLVFLLMIPMNSYDKKLWVEIASQILTGLFCITSLLPLPWRMKDWYYVMIIWRSARITQKRREAQALPPLRDPNDLPDPPQAPFWVTSGGEKLTGPRPPPATAPPPVKKPKKGKAGKGKNEPVPDRPLELARIESKVAGSEGTQEEAVVLTEKEENRLRNAQIKFARSQTWYRPHTTPTHHASPIRWAVWIAMLTVGNSFFQCILCGCMWGMNRWQRPAWTTGCLIPLSFGCGIGAAVLIWQSGERTKRKAEVTRAMWKMLKKDEEDLAARRKLAAEERAARKTEKKKQHHGKPVEEAVDLIEGAVERVEGG